MRYRFIGANEKLVAQSVRLVETAADNEVLTRVQCDFPFQTGISFGAGLFLEKPAGSVGCGLIELPTFACLHLGRHLQAKPAIVSKRGQNYQLALGVLDRDWRGRSILVKLAAKLFAGRAKCNRRGMVGMELDAARVGAAFGRKQSFLKPLRSDAAHLCDVETVVFHHC